MENTQPLSDKKILLVDDERDIIESLEELLEDTFRVDSASSFEEAVSCLKNNTYDVVILDIMGVRGYDLLEATHTLGIPTLMLTAHALSPDNLKKSIEMGADAYIPKHKMVDISMYLEDVLISRQDKKKNNFKWYAKLILLFDKLFGEGWKDPEKEFWDDLQARLVLVREVGVLLLEEHDLEYHREQAQRLSCTERRRVTQLSPDRRQRGHSERRDHGQGRQLARDAEHRRSLGRDSG